ncbi:MAG: hypothetical protein AAF358_13785 [Pseudomonadota bacterium]
MTKFLITGSSLVLVSGATALGLMSQCPIPEYDAVAESAKTDQVIRELRQSARGTERREEAVMDALYRVEEIGKSIQQEDQRAAECRRWMPWMG